MSELGQGMEAGGPPIGAENMQAQIVTKYLDSKIAGKTQEIDSASNRGGGWLSRISQKVFPKNTSQLENELATLKTAQSRFKQGDPEGKKEIIAIAAEDFKTASGLFSVGENSEFRRQEEQDANLNSLKEDLKVLNVLDPDLAQRLAEKSGIESSLLS